jgi:hypothetical protein
VEAEAGFKNDFRATLNDFSSFFFLIDELWFLDGSSTFLLGNLVMGLEIANSGPAYQSSW